MTTISHRRRGKIEVWVSESGTYRRQYDLCPYCKTVMIWEQECDVWTEDDEGEMQPDWEASESWHADCTTCDVYFVDPYNDGLLRVYSLSVEEDE